MNTPSNALRDRFLASARAAADRLAEYGVQLDADPGDAGVLDALRRELHRLRGSAGSYGFTEAGERLGRMEQRAASWAVDQSLEPGMRGALIRQLVDWLRPAFGGEPDTSDELLDREVWCVERPPEGMMTEWSALAPIAGIRLVTMNAAEFREHLRNRERPYAVLASADVGRSLQAPDGLPLVLFGEARHAAGAQERPFGAVTVVDRDITSDDLVVVMEQLAQRTSLAGGSVVVLDDDPLILLLSKAICEDAGLRPVTLANPGLLFSTLEAERPSVLLMDVQLPGTTGFELTRQLRAHPDWSELPVILFSGDASREAREESVAAGADGFLPKPVAPAELRAQLLARIDQVRQFRLAHGLNAATGLPEHDVGLREGEQLFGEYRREGGLLSSVMISRIDSAHDPRWPRTCASLARALRGAGASVAHYDASSLVATIRDGEQPLMHAIEELLNNVAEDPSWAAGVAGATTVGANSMDELWHAAADAANAAIGSHQVWHEWERGDSTRAPDVIIVEDDLAFAELLEYVLRREGYSYRVLTTGPEALEALRALKVGSTKPLILLDLDLPGLDGHAIHERLRVERPRDFVVVFVSVHTGDADQVRALRAGAIDYLAKPLSLRVLMAKLPRWVRQPRSPR